MTVVPRIGQAVSFRRGSKPNGFTVFSRASVQGLLTGSQVQFVSENKIAITPFFPSVADDPANPGFFDFPK
jgi:hypothetical protein